MPRLETFNTWEDIQILKVLYRAKLPIRPRHFREVGFLINRSPTVIFNRWKKKLQYLTADDMGEIFFWSVYYQKSSHIVFADRTSPDGKPRFMGLMPFDVINPNQTPEQIEAENWTRASMYDVVCGRYSGAPRMIEEILNEPPKGDSLISRIERNRLRSYLLAEVFSCSQNGNLQGSSEQSQGDIFPRPTGQTDQNEQERPPDQLGSNKMV